VLTTALGRLYPIGRTTEGSLGGILTFRLGCELAYKVVAETVFIFTVQVAFLQRHINLVEPVGTNYERTGSKDLTGLVNSPAMPSEARGLQGRKQKAGCL
jgi:hypothetical protein